MPPRRRRANAPLMGVLAAVILGLALYVFGFSWWQSRQSPLLEYRDLIVPRLIDVVLLAWLFWVGSAIGSFLNVVAWRMPRGESVNGRSYCPRCKNQLKARDNFPVFGWLALRGRCRHCRLPISPRYPLVEFAVAATVSLVGMAELYRLSLPYQPRHWHGGPFWAPVVDTSLLITLLYHAVAIAFSWAFGLVRFDGHRLPPRLLIASIIGVVVPMVAYPELMVVTWRVAEPAVWNPAHAYLDAVLRVATGLAAAVFYGRYLAQGLCPGADPKLDPLSKRTQALIDLIAVIMIPAVIVGWQAVPAVVVLASLIARMVRRWKPFSADALGRFALAMPLALTIQLVFWRTLHESGWWPSAGAPRTIILSAAASVFLIPLWLRDPRDSSDRDSNDRDSESLDRTRPQLAE